MADALWSPAKQLMRYPYLAHPHPFCSRAVSPFFIGLLPGGLGYPRGYTARFVFPHFLVIPRGLQHLVLRLSLWYYNYMPQRYINFLDYAAERLFLRMVGGGYMFIRRLLQAYFAARHSEPSHAAHPKIAKQGQSASS
jgi:hypothetical protein